MKKNLLILFAGASLLAFAAAPALARGKPDAEQSEHGKSNAHKSDKSNKDKNKNKNDDDDRGYDDDDDDHSRGYDDDNNGNCGLGRRERGDEPPGARDPNAERSADCPAGAGKDDDKYKDRGRDDDDDEDGADDDDDNGFRKRAKEEVEDAVEDIIRGNPGDND